MRPESSIPRTGIAISSVLLLVVAAALNAYAAQPTRCENLRGKPALRLCEQPVEGSKFHRYRVTSALCANVPEIVSLLMDMGTVPEWFPDVLEARHLASQSDGETVYIVNRAPWPMKPRDLVYRFRLEEYVPDGRMHVSISGLPDAIEPVKGYVRVEAANGDWDLLPRGSQTEVTFAMHLELGGVPALVANRRVRETVLGAVRNLGERFPCR
jgi:carbon monoxide dehydrogenase subunit G